MTDHEVAPERRHCSHHGPREAHLERCPECHPEDHPAPSLSIAPALPPCCRDTILAAARRFPGRFASETGITGSCASETCRRPLILGPNGVWRRAGRQHQTLEGGYPIRVKE